MSELLANYIGGAWHAGSGAGTPLGSLVCSLYGSDDAALGSASIELAETHGRVHGVTPEVAQSQTGHGNVMPMSLHGGSGRAGGDELGGLRALNFHHCRAAIRAGTGVLHAIEPQLS